MLLERLRRRVAIRTGDRFDDRGMLIQRLRPAPLRRERGRGQQRHGAMNQIELLDQKPVVRGQVDLAMKALVRPAQRARVRDKRAVGRHHVAQQSALPRSWRAAPPGARPAPPVRRAPRTTPPTGCDRARPRSANARPASEATAFQAAATPPGSVFAKRRNVRPAPTRPVGRRAGRRPSSIAARTIE
jgi:hypothetical protein